MAARVNMKLIRHHPVMESLRHMISSSQGQKANYMKIRLRIEGRLLWSFVLKVASVVNGLTVAKQFDGSAQLAKADELLRIEGLKRYIEELNNNQGIVRFSCPVAAGSAPHCDCWNLA